MLIGHLNPTGKPAQQLMEMLWTDEAGGSKGIVGTAPIHTFTSRLLILGYVVRNSDTLTVRLTDKGRGVARTLSESAEGQLYRAKYEQE